MFGNLRNKFQSIQEGISASFRGLTLSETPKSKTVENERNVNYNAGADLLRHFQMQWIDLHDISEGNAHKAQDADTLISRIHEKLEHEWNSIISLNSSLAAIPKLNNKIQELMDQIGSLQELFQEVEGDLFQLENLQEILELQNTQLDHRFQLALYKEKKFSELKNIREKLANEHAAKVLKHEKEQEKLLRERQQTFSDAFQEELKEYKTTGSLPKTSITQEGPSLDEIVLDTDSTDYDEFLKE